MESRLGEAVNADHLQRAGLLELFFIHVTGRRCVHI